MNLIELWNEPSGIGAWIVWLAVLVFLQAGGGVMLSIKVDTLQRRVDYLTGKRG